MCSRDCPVPRSKDRRIVLPSMATISSSKASAREAVHAVKHCSNASASIKLNTRRNVSWEGIPCWSSMSSDPETWQARASCSFRRGRYLRSSRGPLKPEKWSISRFMGTRSGETGGKVIARPILGPQPRPLHLNLMRNSCRRGVDRPDGAAIQLLLSSRFRAGFRAWLCVLRLQYSSLLPQCPQRGRLYLVC